MKSSRLVVAIAIVAPFVWLFGRAVVSGEVFAFRDAANYYLPLFEWESREWRAGRVPLWNPHDNSGTPFVADVSSSVFYPGKLVFALPLDYIRRFNLYVSLHLLLAAGTTYLLARRLALGVEASGFCAVSYAFGGSVLFQYTNVIFLVGAAWLPWAFLAAHQMLTQRSLRWAVGLGVGLALMTLGGDPQAAYHVMLLAALYAALLYRAERNDARHEKSEADDGPSPDGRPRWWPTSGALLRRRAVLLLVAALSAGWLAAIQILPAMEWTRISERAVFRAPRSVYEVCFFCNDIMEMRRPNSPDDVGASIVKGLFGRPESGTHHEHVYQFSVGPWRLVELLWPNCTGRMFPTNRRWISLLPAEGRVWSPSLYLGLLPLLLALAGWRVRRASPLVQWLSWTVLIALLGSFGWYGLGWLWHEFRVGLTGAPQGQVVLGQPVGGVYWLMVLLLPGYVYFRYPAKWLVVASLGISLLAAHRLDQGEVQRSPAMRRALAWISCISLPGALVAAAAGLYWKRMLQDPPVDAVFGPLDVSGGSIDMSVGLLHTGVVSMLTWLALRFFQNRQRSHWLRFVLLLTSAELLIAQSWLTATIPASTFDRGPTAARRIVREEQDDDRQASSRVFRASPHGWLPGNWSRRSADSRLAEVVHWERNTLSPKYHLPSEVSLVESYSTIASSDYRAFLRVARHHGWRREDGLYEPHRAVLDALSAKYLLFPASDDGERLMPGVEVLGDEEPDGPGPNQLKQTGDEFHNVLLCINHQAFPRAWVVHQVERLMPISTNDPAEIERRTREILFPAGQPRDFATIAVVECETLALAPAASDVRGETCTVTEYGSQRIRIDVRLASPGLLVVNDLYHPGWVAHRVDPDSDRRDELPVYRTNRVMRGVPLPAGRHHVVFAYKPRRFYVGAVLSVVGWVALLVCLFSLRWKCRGAPSGAVSNRQ